MKAKTRLLFGFAVSTLLVVMAMLSGFILTNGPIANQSPAAGPIFGLATGTYFDYVVVVIMENKNLCELYTHCGGSATYMTAVADAYSMLLDYHYGNVNPSLPNYLALSGGTTFGCTTNVNPNSGCATAAWNAPNIVDRLETGGVTWKAYMEDMPSNCYGGNSGGYAVRHNPFVYYRLNVETPSRCNLIIPAGSNDDALLNDLASTSTAKNFMWLTPNNCNNMHDCSIATGDAYLATLIPQILTSTVFTSTRAALYLVVDEGYGNPTYAAWLGPTAKTIYTSSTYYDAYSFLKTLETNWNLDYLTSNDQNAAPMSEFFGPVGPDFSLTANPTSVSFSAGGSATSTIGLVNLGGFSQTVGLTAASNPSGVTTSCDPSAISGTQTSTCTMSAASAGTYTVTITGTSGNLTHTVDIGVTVTAAGPTARFTYSPALPAVNESITFDASSSTDSDPNAILEARWDWEGDSIWDTDWSTTLTASHTYTAPGTYPVNLEIRDNHALTDSASRSVVVLDMGSYGGVGAPPGYGLIDPTKLVARGPIYIGSNAGFTAANGVRSGTGTVADPYVISDWLIDGNLYTTIQVMIHIESTDAYVILENNKILNLAGTNQWEAIQLGHWPATISTQHVTIRHNHIENARHAYGIAVREGSSGILVEANYVRLDANFEWVFGIATDRGVHDVTIVGNYVDAYTSGTFHTSGIHISDLYVDDLRRATGVLAIRNTAVNATAGGIVSLSSTGTRIESNLVYMDYPGSKSVGPDYPRGIMTEQGSADTTVVGNVVHTFHWGIQAGSERGRFLSNTIYNVDYAIFVPDNASWPGVNSFDQTISATSYASAALGGIRLPANFVGTVVDVGPGVLPNDLAPVLLITSKTAATKVSYAWSGTLVNVTVTSGGADLFDTADSLQSQALQAIWTGAITSLDVATLLPNSVSFQLQSAVDVAFAGSGFTPGAMYNLTRSNPGGTTIVLSAPASPTGVLAFTIPAAVPSLYGLTPDSIRDTLAPVTTASLAGSSGTNGWYTAPVSVTLASIDDLSGVAAIHHRLDGGAWQTYTAPVPVSGDLSHTIEYYATDFAGNDEAVRSVAVKIDSTKAVTSAQVAGTLNPDGSYSDHVTFTLSAVDATSGVQSILYRINAGAWRTYVSPFPVGGNGSHTVDYGATDAAGNVEDTKSSVVRITNSLHAPPTTTADVVGSAGQNGWFVSTTDVILTATSPSGSSTSIAYSLDGTSWTAYSGRFTLSEGRYTLHWQAWDVDGYFEPVKTREVLVDVTNPTIEALSPSGQVTGADVTLSWTGSDSVSGIVRYEVSVDSGPFESIGTVRSVTRHFSDGAHHVQVKAVDQAGHESVSSTDFSVEPTGVFFPGPLQAIPLYFPAMGLGLLAVSYLLIRHRRRKEWAQDRSEDRDSDDEDSESYESDEP